jgi:hypothetical protein
MGYSCPSWLEDVASFSNGWPVRITSRAGVLSWARMISAAHSTIDIAEPARDIERAAEIFARSEGATFPAEAISNLRLAVVLLMAIVPDSTQYEAERAVIAEFMTRSAFPWFESYQAASASL